MLGSSSGDVVARQEVVAAATVHRVRPVASSTDNVEALQVLRSAVAWLHLVAASTAMLAKSQWMDWSTVSSPQSGTCREVMTLVNTVSNNLIVVQHFVMQTGCAMAHSVIVLLLA